MPFAKPDTPFGVPRDVAGEGRVVREVHRAASIGEIESPITCAANRWHHVTLLSVYPVDRPWWLEAPVLGRR